MILNPALGAQHVRRARIVEFVRINRHTTAEQLATRLQSSKRTIYRDVMILQAYGVPIGGISGDGYRWLERGERPEPIAR